MINWKVVNPGDSYTCRIDELIVYTATVCDNGTVSSPLLAGGAELSPSAFCDTLYLKLTPKPSGRKFSGYKEGLINGIPCRELQYKTISKGWTPSSTEAFQKNNDLTDNGKTTFECYLQ